MSKAVTITFDEEILSGLDKTPEEMACEMSLAAAIKWYETGMLSQEYAAKIAGLSRSDFIMALSRYDVSPMQETADDIIHAFLQSMK